MEVWTTKEIKKLKHVTELKWLDFEEVKAELIRLTAFKPSVVVKANIHKLVQKLEVMGSPQHFLCSKILEKICTQKDKLYQQRKKPKILELSEGVYEMIVKYEPDTIFYEECFPNSRKEYIFGLRIVVVKDTKKDIVKVKEEE